MAKKKPILNLKSQNIEFFLEQTKFKIISFNPNNMTFDVLTEDKDSGAKIKNFPFAHAPKKIKKLDLFKKS